MTMELSETMTAIELIGFPMDLGAGRRGVDMGPSALRIAGIDSHLASMGYRVIDQGDIAIDIQECQQIRRPRLKYLEEIVRASALLVEKVEAALSAGHIPLCLGGDHSAAVGSLAGVTRHCRHTDQTLGVIWIDAHPDFNTEDTTSSGNIHGMVAAAASGLGHPDLVGLGGVAPKIEPGNLVMVGIRNVDPLEGRALKDHGVHVITMTDIDRIGIAAAAARMLDRLNGSDHIHVSFDMDSVDPSTAPGVGTPVPGGLTFREAHLLMETIAENGRLGSMDVVEVNPILDVRNRSAALAVDLVSSCFGKRIL
jgi:arginase